MSETERRLLEFEADLTPVGVVRQLVAELPPQRGRVLDPSAGHGVFAQCLRERVAGVHVTGVEPRGECLLDLARHCDGVCVGTFEEYRARWSGRVFDAVTTYCH